MPLEAAQLIKDDQDHLIHPLHHPSDHLEPMVYVRGRGAVLTDVQGREYIDGLAGLWNVNVGHGRDRAGGRGGRADARAGLLLRVLGLDQYPGHPARLQADDDRVSEHAGRVLHLGRRRVQRVRVQDRALLLEDQGQARQGEDHLALVFLPRRDAAGDERHRHVALLEDVRAARAGLRAHPNVLSVPSGGRQAGRDRGADRRAPPGGGHRARGRRHGGRVHRRADPRRRRGALPDRRLLPAGAEGLRQARRALHRGRGHHRLLPDRQVVRARALERAARHRLLREGRVLRAISRWAASWSRRRSSRPWTT